MITLKMTSPLIQFVQYNEEISSPVACWRYTMALLNPASANVPANPIRTVIIAIKPRSSGGKSRARNTKRTNCRADTAKAVAPIHFTPTVAARLNDMNDTYLIGLTVKAIVYTGTSPIAVVGPH